ncbi:MAG: hypothetical protein QF511_10900 [Rhodospirillales bacterium]|jgi:hypothetical protein|nr:hypothetical protein [Rhodospirillales bacterium]MDP7215844.1 hypothetical protein [Rhodospirillales bacterium]HJP55222.1 hypothetical protein [Rhodospirillales bacterium]
MTTEVEVTRLFCDELLELAGKDALRAAYGLGGEPGDDNNVYHGP